MGHRIEPGMEASERAVDVEQNNESTRERMSSLQQVSTLLEASVLDHILGILFLSSLSLCLQQLHSSDCEVNEFIVYRICCWRYFTLLSSVNKFSIRR